jgi:hypothetical protein
VPQGPKARLIRLVETSNSSISVTTDRVRHTVKWKAGAKSRGRGTLQRCNQEEDRGARGSRERRRVAPDFGNSRRARGNDVVHLALALPQQIIRQVLFRRTLPCDARFTPLRLTSPTGRLIPKMPYPVFIVTRQHHYRSAVRLDHSRSCATIPLVSPILAVIMRHPAIEGP